MKSNTLRDFIKKETVLSVAASLALISCFFVPPSAAYLSYIDFRTLALLFCLMAVMAGLRAQGIFFSLGRRLLGMAGGMLQVVLILVMLCFFGSMVITNDVALLTFVPFTFAVLDMLGPAARQKWVVPVVCMQTIAANLGSMFTPIGNPQNLYLYGKSGLSMAGFLQLMFPFSLVSLVLLAGWCLFLCRKEKGRVRICWQEAPASQPDNKKLIALYAFLFLLCLLTVLHILPWAALLLVVLCAVFVANRSVLADIDYSLLLTFAGFFIFIGNLGRIPAFSGWLQSTLAGREVLTAVLASQVISNVPAALLLSGFTDKTALLIIGTNLGGLGTLIASMASLISFRQIAEAENEHKGQYFRLFTISNLAFLAVLLVVAALI